MKFILKDKQVYVVENYGIPNNNIEGTVEAPGFEDYKLTYKINNGPYKQLSNGKAVIDKEYLKNTTLKLMFRLEKGDSVLYFKSDEIPITQAVILGKRLEDAFPERFKHLERRMDAVEKALNNKQKEINHIIEETIEVFEDITRKGSLF